MICVSIGRTRHQMVMFEQRSLAEQGARLVELRLDYLGRAPDLKRLLTDRPTPCIVTCRRQSDRGKWRRSEEERLAILRQAIVDGVEYVDLEGDIAASIRRYGKTQRVVSHHDFDETPEDLAEIHERLCKLDPDIVKLVTMANEPADMVRMLRLVAGSKVPTVGFCMGELGMPSRILCGKYGSPFTYASFSSERELAPGQISFEEMRDIYHYDAIGPRTRVYGVIGDPIAHSLSPKIHNAAFATETLDCAYVPFRIPRHALKDSLKAFEWLDIRGYSVTIPHKEAVLDLVDFPDESSKDIGAANTLYRDSQRYWRATNTDLSAALTSIKLGLKSDAAGEVSLSGRTVLMLGAGGAARAIGLGLVRAGAALTISNRTASRGLALAEHLGCRHVQWENRGSVFADILINCTPIGMHPHVDDSPFAENWFRDGMLVFDTIYNPENTLFLKQAREHGCTTVSGVEMFVRQAALQFERFMEQPAPFDAMRQALRRSISAVKL